MNINGHEVERREDGRVYVDDERTLYGGDADPDYYTRHAELIRKEAEHADLVGEFVRREQAEKAAQDAARELDRRARLACESRFGPGSWDLDHCRIEDWRNVVRALDADTAEQVT